MKTAFFLCVAGWQATLWAATFSHPSPSVQFEYEEKLWELVPTDTKSAQPQQDVDKAMAQKTIVSLQRKQADEKYRSRFSIVVDSVEKALKGKEQLTFSKYQNYAIEFLKSQRFTIQKEGKRVLKGAADAYEVIAYQRDFGLTFHQIMIPRDGEVFLVTLSTRTKLFPNYSTEMDKMLESLRFGTTVSSVQLR